VLAGCLLLMAVQRLQAAQRTVQRSSSSHALLPSLRVIQAHLATSENVSLFFKNTKGQRAQVKVSVLEPGENRQKIYFTSVLFICIL
jgi:hypothetical protein